MHDPRRRIRSDRGTPLIDAVLLGGGRAYLAAVILANRVVR
tara:strand:- start:46 stop:168 length:123 start_codon:yes stop_codon:yes gene_type:complete